MSVAIITGSAGLIGSKATLHAEAGQIELAVQTASEHWHDGVAKEPFTDFDVSPNVVDAPLACPSHSTARAS